MGRLKGLWPAGARWAWGKSGKEFPERGPNVEARGEGASEEPLGRLMRPSSCSRRQKRCAPVTEKELGEHLPSLFCVLALASGWFVLHNCSGLSSRLLYVYFHTYALA